MVKRREMKQRKMGKSEVIASWRERFGREEGTFPAAYLFPTQWLAGPLMLSYQVECRVALMNKEGKLGHP